MEIKLKRKWMKKKTPEAARHGPGRLARFEEAVGESGDDVGGVQLRLLLLETLQLRGDEVQVVEFEGQHFVGAAAGTRPHQVVAQQRQHAAAPAQVLPQQRQFHHRQRQVHRVEVHLFVFHRFPNPYWTSSRQMEHWTPARSDGSLPTVSYEIFGYTLRFFFFHIEPHVKVSSFKQFSKLIKNSLIEIGWFLAKTTEASAYFARKLTRILLADSETLYTSGTELLVKELTPKEIFTMVTTNHKKHGFPFVSNKISVK